MIWISISDNLCLLCTYEILDQDTGSVNHFIDFCSLLNISLEISLICTKQNDLLDEYGKC